METKVIAYEKASSTEFHAVDVEVICDGKTFKIAVTLCGESYRNSGWRETKVANAEFEGDVPSAAVAAEMLEAAKKAALNHETVLVHSNSMLIRERIESCSRQELEEVVLGVVDALYLQYAGDTFKYNHDKQWDADTCDGICSVLVMKKLIPGNGEKRNT